MADHGGSERTPDSRRSRRTTLAVAVVVGSVGVAAWLVVGQRRPGAFERLANAPELWSLVSMTTSEVAEVPGGRGIRGRGVFVDFCTDSTEDDTTTHWIVVRPGPTGLAAWSGLWWSARDDLESTLAGVPFRVTDDVRPAGDGTRWARCVRDSRLDRRWDDERAWRRSVFELEMSTSRRR